MGGERKEGDERGRRQEAGGKGRRGGGRGRGGGGEMIRGSERAIIPRSIRVVYTSLETDPMSVS